MDLHHSGGAVVHGVESVAKQAAFDDSSMATAAPATIRAMTTLAVIDPSRVPIRARLGFVRGRSARAGAVFGVLMFVFIFLSIRSFNATRVPFNLRHTSSVGGGGETSHEDPQS